MKKAFLLAAASALLISADSASAQTRANDVGWWPWAGAEFESASTVRDRNDDRDERGRISDDQRGKKEKKGNGPPFCRNGQGHPVHGMAWCREKGWTNGWDRARWGDVILRSPRGDSKKDSRYDQPTLGGILGSVILGRLTGYAQRLGTNSPLTARVVDLGRQGSVLQVRAGGLPLAEFTDFNRDGRVDLVLLAQAG